MSQRTIAFYEPPFARWLFASTAASPIWFLVRLYLGWQWLSSGLQKVGSPMWTGAQSGAALTGFVQGALQKTQGPHPDVSPWYASFLQNVVLPHASTFSWMVAVGETLVGIALILGLFTGIAAFFGAFMNVNFLLAGTVSSNPILFLLAIFLILAWRNAGWWGLDRWALTWLGTPWQPGELFEKHQP
ncbi:MAG: DoxX family protein [Bacillota bacterium]|nr:DoxX family protein [Bacillota bacterium]